MNIKNIPFFLLKSLTKFTSYWYKIHYRSISEIHKNAKLLPTAKIINLQKDASSIRVDSETLVLGELLIFAHAGKITVGKSCYIGESTRIWSAAKIEIGDRVLISHNVNIHDTDGHPIDSNERHKHFQQISTTGHPIENINISASPIFIEDDVWIGFNSTILKGVTIGKGAIVGASSVVTKNIAPYTIVGGNPAKLIRNINPDEFIKTSNEDEADSNAASHLI